MTNIVTYPIIGLNDVKEALDITTSADDDRLTGYINRATDLVESYCNRRFAQTTYTNETYSGDGGMYLQLRQWPVTSLTKLEVRTGDFANPGWQTIDSSSYTLKSEGGRDRGVIAMISLFPQFYAGGRAWNFFRGTDNFRVSYVAGYAAADMPNDLQEAIIEIVSWLYNRRKATPGMKSETLGKYSYTLDTPTAGNTGIIGRLGLADILSAYRTPAFG